MKAKIAIPDHYNMEDIAKVAGSSGLASHYNDGILTVEGCTQTLLDKALAGYVYKDISYQVKRAVEYPDIGDQLDAIMKWLSTESEFTIPAELKSIAMKCMSVKAKYPKPDGVE